jgi:hypothetical protein
MLGTPILTMESGQNVLTHDITDNNLNILLYKTIHIHVKSTIFFHFAINYDCKSTVIPS